MEIGSGGFGDSSPPPNSRDLISNFYLVSSV